MLLSFQVKSDDTKRRTPHFLNPSAYSGQETKHTPCQTDVEIVIPPCSQPPREWMYSDRLDMEMIKLILPPLIQALFSVAVKLL